MKKILLVVVIALAGVATMNAQFNVGVKAGFNASTITNIGQIMDDQLDMTYKPGFTVGVAAQYLFTPQAGIETGLYYSALGVKGSFGGNNTKVTATFSPSYLQLPITFLYKFEVGPGLSLYPDAGIYLGYGLGGKVKVDTKLDGKKIDELSTDDDFFGKGDSGEESTNRFDYGVTAGLNLQYDKFVIGVGYDLGLAKINKELEDGFKDWKNGNIRVSLGYFF